MTTCARWRRFWRSFEGERCVKKTPWPPLGGGSARRRWGRELYVSSEVSGKGKALSLPEGCSFVKKHLLCLIENVGANIVRPPTWRSNAFLGKASRKTNGHGRAVLAPTMHFFDTLPSQREAFRQPGANHAHPCKCIIPAPAKSNRTVSPCRTHPGHIGRGWCLPQNAPRRCSRPAAAQNRG